MLKIELKFLLLNADFSITILKSKYAAQGWHLEAVAKITPEMLIIQTIINIQVSAQR